MWRVVAEFGPPGTACEADARPCPLTAELVDLTLSPPLPPRCQGCGDGWFPSHPVTWAVFASSSHELRGKKKHSSGDGSWQRRRFDTMLVNMMNPHLLQMATMPSAMMMTQGPGTMQGRIIILVSSVCVCVCVRACVCMLSRGAERNAGWRCTLMDRPFLAGRQGLHARGVRPPISLL